MNNANQITKIILRIVATLAIISAAISVIVYSNRHTGDVIQSYAMTNNIAPLLIKWLDIGIFAILSFLAAWNLAGVVWRSRMRSEVLKHDDTYRHGELGRAKDEVENLKIELRNSRMLAKDRENRLREVIALSEHWLSMDCMEKLRKIAMDPLRNL